MPPHRPASGRQHNPSRLRCSICQRECRNASGLTQHFNTKHAVQKDFYIPQNHDSERTFLPDRLDFKGETDDHEDFEQLVLPEVSRLSSDHTPQGSARHQPYRVEKHPLINGE